MKSTQILTKTIFSLGLVSLVGFSPLVTCKTVNAAIVNGSFESGFTNWSTGGVSSIETAGFNVNPTNGNNQALLTTADDSLLTDISGGLEDFLGVELGVFSDPDNIFDGAATEGSALWQDFTAEVGEVLKFDWNFLTNDTTGNDYAFVVLGQVSELGNITYSTLPKLNRASGLVTSNSSFAEETGYKTFSYAIPSTGTYRLGIGIVDVPDTEFDSGILVDNVTLEAVPEPVTILGSGLVLGFTMLGKKAKTKK